MTIISYHVRLLKAELEWCFFFLFFFCRFCNYCGQREEGNGVLWAKIGMIFYIINVYIQNMMMMIVTGKNMLHRIFVSDYCYY